MNCFGFVIVFGLSCVLFPCKGQITSPPDGSTMTVLSGSTVNITWSFSDDVSQVISRVWYFTSSDGSFVQERLARIIDDENPRIFNSGLSGVSVVKPATLLLKNVNQTYNGTYRFDLSGRGGSGSSQVAVFIAITPTITINCSTPTTLIEGDNFACECKGTDGNPPADVTWYKNNTQIVTGKQEAILSLRNVGKDNNRTYRCDAKSGIEEAKNETSIDLIINLIPIITVNCSSVNIVNRSDNFVCKCEGKEGYLPADVFWYKNNIQIVTGKEEAILALSNVDKDDNRTYRCEAKSSENAKNETSIELIVNYPPENVRLMLTRRAERVTITCAAEARPAPSFEIFRSETVLVKTITTYIIREVNDSHVGNYTCVAENLLGKKSSKPRYLSFEATPIITVNCSSPSTVHQGNNFTCECKGTDGYPPANVTWYKDNTKIVTGKEEAILVLSNVDKGHNGTYRCEAKSHENAKNKTSIDLIITITPMITVNCSNVTYANQSDNFACECNGTDGNPPADVTWYNSSGKIVTGKENAILSLSNVSREDNGTYRCEAKSHERARNKISIDLFVTLTPNITVNCSSPTTLPEGDNLKCKCRGTDGNPPADVTWYNSSGQIVAVGNKKEEAILVLSNFGRDDSGTYRCEAKSHENAREFVLKVNVKTSTTSTTSSTTMKPGPTHKDEQSDGPSGGVIAGIIVGVLALLGIIIFVVYYIKTRKRQGYKGNANVNPDDADVVVELKENEGFAKGENSYDSVKVDDAYASVKGDNAYDSIKGDNAYDSVNHSGSSASTSKPPEDTLPPVYAAVDKGNKKGKPLYATLDSVALESTGSQKSKENRPPPTEYATLDSLALQSNDSTKRDEDRPKPTEYADIDFLKSKEGENTGHPV